MKPPNADTHHVKPKDVTNALNGVTKFASINPHLQNNLFNEEIPLFLQINSFKIPKTRGPVKEVFRVPLANAPLPSNADVCLIVPDVKGIPNQEHERHQESYETLLQQKGVCGIKKIMTFHEFRTEYDTFELKNRLADLYDVFLVDGRISGKVVNKCGSIFFKKRKLPLAVKLHLPSLKSHIEQSLKKSFFKMHTQSDSHCVQIGHSNMKVKELKENVYSVIEFINSKFPGGMGNIRSLNVYAHRGSSIPIYISLKNPNDVAVPTLSQKLPKAYKSVKGELTTENNSEVLVRPSGAVIVTRKKTESPDEQEAISDADIIRENKKIDSEENLKSQQGKSKRGRKRKSELDTTDGANIDSINEIPKVKKKKPGKNSVLKAQVSRAKYSSLSQQSQSSKNEGKHLQKGAKAQQFQKNKKKPIQILKNEKSIEKQTSKVLRSKVKNSDVKTGVGAKSAEKLKIKRRKVGSPKVANLKKIPKRR